MSIVVNDFAVKAYKKYRAAGMTPEGACGLMGNQYAESAGFKADRLEFLCVKRLREQTGKTWTDEEYTAAVDSGEITADEFLHPLTGKVYGYGLCQWTSIGRKAALYNEAHKRGCSIGDENLAVDFTIKELQNDFPTVWKCLTSAKTVKEASDCVLVKFEMPADTSDAVRNTRIAYSQAYYDTFVQKTVSETKTNRTPDTVLQVAKMWLGKKEADGSHKIIIDTYNAHKPLARGYKVQYSDAWCDTFVSACFIASGMSDLTGTECGCEEHIKIFKQKGIWNEDGRITPEVGDIIVYAWSKATQQNDNYSDHIGIVEAVNSGTITVIEGNYNDEVGRRVIPVGWGYIRGYARPKYDQNDSVALPKSNDSVALEAEEKAPYVVYSLDVLDKCKEWFDRMEKDGDWRYNNKGSNVSHEAAIKKNNHVTNCARAIVHALQYAGILEENQSFYGNKSGGITAKKGAVTTLKKYCTVTHYANGKRQPKDIALKPGDIICYYGQHTNLYIGKDDKGRMQWLDAGRGTTEAGRKGKDGTNSIWKSFDRYGNVGMYISNVIRWKTQGLAKSEPAKQEQQKRSSLSETVKWTGKIETDLYCRVYAGANYPTIKSYPVLPEGASVGVCDEVKANDGKTWYFVKYKNVFGFCSSSYVKKV